MFYSYLNLQYKSKVETVNIGAADVHNFIKHQQKEKKSVNTLNKYIKVLKNYFNYVWEENLIAVDPIQKLKYFKAEKPIYDLNVETLDNIFKSMETIEIELKKKCVFILAMQGFKSSELYIKKDDVKIEGDVVLIHLHNRVIDISDIGAKIVKEYLESISNNANPYLFPSPVNPLRSIDDYRFRSYLKELSVLFNAPHLTFERIRQTLILNDYKKGIPIEKIAYHYGVLSHTVALFISKFDDEM